MDNLPQVSNETLEESIVQDTQQLRFSSISSRMPMYSTAEITGNTAGVYPTRFTNNRVHTLSNSDMYWMPNHEYMTEIIDSYSTTFSTTPIRLSHSYNIDLQDSVGYFKIPTENIDVKIYTKFKPTQETLDELYDLFKWTFHDN